MKLLDDRGRLFGSINIIDLGVILVIVLLIGAGARRMGKAKTLANTKTATITVEVADVRENIGEALMLGDSIYPYAKDEEFGQIIDKKIEAYREAVKDRDGNTEMKEVPEKYLIILSLKAEIKEDPNAILVGGEPTRIDSEFKFENKNVEFSGRILSLEID